MDGPLTPALYKNLEDRFGSVIIANQGEEMVVHRQTALTASRTVQGQSLRTKANISHPGEYYRVCCPKCNDTRHRLWINHRVVEFPWLIVCFNEDCYRSIAVRDQLLMTLFRTRRPARPRVNPGKRETTTLRQVTMPGKCVRLDNLPMSHPANQYLADERGYDPCYLGEAFGVAYCEYSGEYRQCDNKIIIPIWMNGKLVGWQARFIGDRNWKAAAVPKYWDLPKMAKRLMLYNHDQAKKHRWVGLQEGVTDVWSTGRMMMSLLGSTITFAQRKLLAFTFRDKPLVMMLDGDAYLANEMITEELRRTHPAGVVQVNLPNGKDPGDFSPEVNMDMIHQAARAQGVVLPGGVV
jgi:hypothetical protein